MSRVMISLLVYFLLCCLNAGSVLAADVMKREFEKTVPLRSGGRVEIKNVTGPATITGWDREEVRVRAVISCDLEMADDKERDLFQEVQVVVDNNWNQVTIKTHYPDTDWGETSEDGPDIDLDFEIGDDGEEESAFISGIMGMVGRVVGGVTSWVTGLVNDRLPVVVSYEVFVPEHCDLELNTVTGDLQISGIDGDIETGLITGNTALVDATGRLDCNVVTGDIEIEGAAGEVRTSVITGDVVLTLDRDRDIHGVHCSVVNGDIVLRVPEGRGLDFTLNAVNGDIRMDLDGVNDTEVSGKRFAGSVAGGGADIEANAVNGSVRVERTVR